MYNSLTKESVQDIREMITDKLADLEDLGIKFDIGTITYGNESFNCKIQCSLISAGSKYEIEWKKSPFYFKYPNAIGKVVEVGAKKYIFEGFKPRSRKKGAIIRNTETDRLHRIEFYAIEGQL